MCQQGTAPRDQDAHRDTIPLCPQGARPPVPAPPAFPREARRDRAAPGPGGRVAGRAPPSAPPGGAPARPAAGSGALGGWPSPPAAQPQVRPPPVSGGGSSPGDRLVLLREHCCKESAALAVTRPSRLFPSGFYPPLGRAELPQTPAAISLRSPPLGPGGLHGAREGDGSPQRLPPPSRSGPTRLGPPDPAQRRWSGPRPPS